MTHHFVNLVSWRFFVDKDSEDMIINIDSVSLKLLITLFTKQSVRRNPGVRAILDFRRRQKDYFWLTARPTEGLENQYSLRRNIVDSDFDSVVKRCADSSAKAIIIGISSPKQDRLARYLNLKLGTLDIYCFGAAVYSQSSVEGLFDRLGVSWLSMLIKSPSRTLGKIKVTIKEIGKICLITRDRKLFKLFIEKVGENF